MRIKYSLLAIMAGVMLGVMIEINTQLAGQSSAVQASWFAHGVGALSALVLYLCANLKSSKNSAATTSSLSTPVWAYLGGLPGSVVVVLAAICVSSPLGLSGTILLGLAGQSALALLIDKTGYFGMQKRHFRFADSLSAVLIFSGCVLFIVTG